MPEETVWELQPHTLGKHKVLRRYLEAWIPIMASWSKRILFIDGFAGPGEYQAGEPGSPVIAMRALIEHAHEDVIEGEVGFIFIEDNKDRCEHLKQVIKPIISKLPGDAWVGVYHDKFNETLTEVLDYIDDQASQLAPSFVMIDPFGVSDTPMSVIRRILQNDRSEVFISFQYEYINRFASTPEFKPHLDDLFGTDEWEGVHNIQDPEKRKLAYYAIYEQQLRAAGAEFVLRFELYEGNRLVYTIFFGTQHLVGSDRMKKAIWKVAPWGDYQFRPIGKGQLPLGIAEPDLSPLMDQIAEEFQEEGWVQIERLKDFIKSDRTLYHSGHLKRGALRTMEIDDRIDVDESTRNRRKTYPDGTMLRIRN